MPGDRAHTFCSLYSAGLYADIPFYPTPTEMREEHEKLLEEEKENNDRLMAEAYEVLNLPENPFRNPLRARKPRRTIPPPKTSRASC